jgi:NhaA family Na+:H+ antiporter
VIDDGLMALFFFVVGLEIKREWIGGELRDRRAAALPALAAVGGMVVPALVYLAVAGGGPTGRGWGVAMATDIAFAVGVLSLLGERVPRSLKVFLLTLAIVDDIGAIVVIALFYGGDLSMAWLAAAASTSVVIALAWRAEVRRAPVFVVLGFVLWLCTYRAGVHATIAGVVMAFLTPIGSEDRPIGPVVEERLHPWSAFLVVPLFALANAGIDLGGRGFDSITAVSAGVVVGLVVGKPLGIALGAGAAVRLGIARLPDGVRPAQLAAVGALGGIGFTVSLFIAPLAFPDGARLDEAKAGVLVASVAAAVIGALALVATSGAIGRRSGKTALVDAPETVTDAVRLLREEGYAVDVELRGDELVWGPGGPTCRVDVAEVDRLYRFEGESDPGDEMVVFAVHDPATGHKGVLSSAFGPAADPATLDHLVGLSQRHRD